MKNGFLIVSDLHLEKKSTIEKQFILDAINDKLEATKTSMKTSEELPTLICAGDLHNGIKGLEWLSQVNAQVIYICGNHEFWDNDYEDVIVDIKNNLPSNVHFLHNDFVVLQDKIFLGGTLWSDLGKDFNPDLFKKSSNVMNDSYYISYKSWYEKPENVEKITSFYKDSLQLPEVLEKKQWNIFAEREENEKTINFIKDFHSVYEVLNAIPNALKRLDDAVHSKFSFMKITEEEYITKKKDLLSYNTSDDYFNWINKNQKILDVEESEFLLVNEQRAAIFNRLKKYAVNDLKIVLVSHHLPFLEERLIGRQEWFDEDINKEYYRNLPESIYSLRKGLDYPYHNYFYRISKGEMTKDESITKVIHYHNDGSNNLPLNFLEKVYCCVHGHEHSYNYEDCIKGIKIATNPLSHSMAVFKFNNGKTELNSHYKSYHNVEDENAEIARLKDSFLRVVNTSYSKEHIQTTGDIWALKHFNWQDYKDLYSHIEKLNKKLFKKLVQAVSLEQVTTENMFDLRTLADSIDYSINKLENMEQRLNEGAAIRKDVHYSFNRKYAHALELHGPSNYFKTINSPLKKFNMPNKFENDYDIEFCISNVFYNIEYMRYNNESLGFVQQIMENLPFNRIYEIDEKISKKFYDSFENKQTLYKFDLDKNIHTKYNQLMQKIRERNPKLNARHKAEFYF